jgi:hypothetical protein
MFKKLCVVAAVVLASCSGESGDVETIDRNEEILEIIDNLIDAGYPESEIEVKDDGRVFVGGDAHVTLQASREMIGLTSDGHGDEFRQYRTTNLVNTNIVDTICIDGSAFNGTMGQGLDMAIANYNQQNLAFTMVRTTGNQANCDALIVGSVKGAAGGMSGFPSGGMPYGSFQIGKSTANYGVDVVEHVITHELGHAVGFRHSDYYNRAISCGSGGNEGASTVGAIHIPGTPQTASMNGSVMNACFHGGSTGEWTASDITALNALY